jgi:uncharacterized peroxidase-related enzyme
VDVEAREAMIAALVAAIPPSEVPLLTARERALVTYADKLTRAPSTIRAPDIDALRAAGLDDLGIHDACAVVAYFAFVNRIADGLGVELEVRADG